MESSIFLNFQLPNAATWFYFSLFLTVALFFQFNRLLSVRNLDLLMLFLLVPGFLFLREAADIDAVVRENGDPGGGLTRRAGRERVLGYIWVLSGSLFWFVRAILDSVLVRRPPLVTNLNTPGLAWLGLALFVGLTAVATRPTPDQANQAPVGQKPATIDQVQDTATAVVQQAQNTNGGNASREAVRFWAERSLAMLGHAAIVVGLLMIGWRHFGDITAGVAAAALYTLVPYTAYNVGQFHHVLPTAFLVWAIFCYRRPTLAGWLLGLAVGCGVFPALLFPLWFGFFSRRGAMRFGFAFLAASAISIGVTALVLWLAGPTGRGVVEALNLAYWKPWAPPTTESVWSGTHWAYRLPLFVLFVGFLVSATIWPVRKNLSHLIAQSAAILIGVQFWHADHGGLYVLWYLPLLLLMVLRPNLTTAEPPPIAPGSVLTRLAGAAWRRVRPGTANEKPLAV